MSVISVDNAAQLQAALKSAKAGDTISLAAGSYGDVVISNAFSSAVTIKSADASNPAVFNSVKLLNASNINFDNIDVKLTPTATSAVWTPAVTISGSTNISFSGGLIESGKAINGVPQSATTTDATGNVIGLYQGVGVQMLNSSGVTLSGLTLTQLDKGVTMQNVSNVTISNNVITELRQSGIDGAELTNVTIDSNQISSSQPWGWGSGTEKDHADFIHLWTQAGTTQANTGIKITNNTLNQGDLAGTGILGILLEDNNGAGYTNSEVSNNTIINNNWQGIYVENMHSSTLSGNTLVQAQGAYNGQPALVFAAGSSGNTVTNNIAAQVETNTGGSITPANTSSGNIQIQNTNSSGAGFLSQSSVAAFNTSSASQIRSQVLAELGLSSAAGGSGAGSASSGGSSAGVSGAANNAGGTTGNAASNPTYSAAAAAISANLDALSANSAVKSIVITDNAPLSISAAQVKSDAAALAKLSNANGSPYRVHVTDTAANVSAALDSLVANNAHVSSISLTDNAAVTVTLPKLAGDYPLLCKIAGEHLITITGYKDLPYSSVTLDIDAQGVWLSKTMHNNDGSDTVMGNVHGLTFASSTRAQTITVTSPLDTFVFDQGFGSETIVGYQPGHDVLSFSHVLFAQAAAVIDAAGSDGHGGTLIKVQGGNSIDLVGVSPTQLQQHKSDIHIF